MRQLKYTLCMKKIAVLIPCYNEEMTIARVVSDFKQALPDATVYVYDNNSTDGSAERAEARGAIVRREPKQGKGNVVRTMFREIDADCYLIVDGDDTYPAEFAPEMCFNILENNVDMVIGDRLSSTYFSENTRLFHSAGNKLVKRLINYLFHSEMKDIMTGYRAFSPLFVKTFPVLSKSFEVETEMTIHALDKNLNIVEIPVPYRDRPEHSPSKLNTYSDGFKVLFTIFRLFKDFRPLPFFSLFSALLASFSAGFFVPVFVEYIQTGIVPRFPTLIVSCFLMLAAILCFFCGLILDTVTKKSRQDFEFKLNIMSALLRKDS